MARLPMPGQDSGKWGDILNEFLSTVHNVDGSLKTNSVTAEALAPQAVKADNIVATGGQDGQVLVKEASATGGMAWRTPSGGTVAPATTTSLGTIQLSGALGGTATAPTVPGLANKVDTSQLGAANGVATLGSDGKVPSAQLPAAGGGGAVTSVAGKTGVVTLVKADVGLSNVDNTADTAKPVSTAVQTALNAKADTAAMQTALSAKADATAVYTKTESDNKFALIGSTGATTLDGLSDVTASGATNGQALVYNGTEWGPATVGTGTATIPDATDSVKGVITLAGDLGGDASTPLVTKLNGVAISGTPAAGKVLTASGASAAAWTTPSAGGTTGGYAFSIKPVTAATVTAVSNDCIMADPTSNAITVTLPAPVANGIVRVKRTIAGGGNGVQVAAPGGSMLDAPSVGSDVLNFDFQSQDYWSDGTKWYRV